MSALLAKQCEKIGSKYILFYKQTSIETNSRNMLALAQQQYFNEKR